jgi:hypothetical protein
MRSDYGDWVFHHITSKKCHNRCICANQLFVPKTWILEKCHALKYVDALGERRVEIDDESNRG